MILLCRSHRSADGIPMTGKIAAELNGIGFDPSVNLFKIVSARYGRKKSLWSPQVNQEPHIVPVIKR